MKTPTHRFIVTLRANVTKDAARRYIKEAVGAWGGQFPPEDPLFGLKTRDVSVHPIPTKPTF